MASRFFPGIRVEEFIAIEDPDDEGTYEARWGRAWVHAKLSDPTKPFMLVNELLGMRLAAALGLPTLPGEIALDPNGGHCWVTPRITSPTGGTPPPPIPAAINADHPVVVAGMIAFDAWIHNLDRTEYNVLYDVRLGLWLIDHENAFAEPDGRAFDSVPEQAAKTPLSSHGFGSQPIDADSLKFWIRRIQQIPDHVIERPIDEANRRGLITQVHMKWLTRYLLARQKDLARLVPNTKHKQPVGADGDDEQLSFAFGSEEG